MARQGRLRAQAPAGSGDTGARHERLLRPRRRGIRSAGARGGTARGLPRASGHRRLSLCRVRRRDRNHARINRARRSGLVRLPDRRAERQDHVVHLAARSSSPRPTSRCWVCRRCGRSSNSSCPRLSAGILPRSAPCVPERDGRLKPGHDERRFRSSPKRLLHPFRRSLSRRRPAPAPRPFPARGRDGRRGSADGFSFAEAIVSKIAVQSAGNTVLSPV